MRCSVVERQKSMPRQVLIIGYGNPLRRDDSLGWHASRLLARLNYAPDASTRVEMCHQLTPDLAALVSEVDLVIFIDAMRRPTSSAPGSQSTEGVYCQAVEPDPTAASNLSHYLTPQALLTYTHLLYHHYPRAFMLSVIGSTFDYGENLSPAMREAVPLLLEHVQRLINSTF